VKVLITGSNGFIGQNFQLRLRDRPDVQVVCFNRGHQLEDLSDLLEEVDFIFHLAGINRPSNPEEFLTGNIDLTRDLCQQAAAIAQKNSKPITIIYTSSTQATLDNPYGRSKHEAEQILTTVEKDSLVSARIFRLPNVFGKWCKPNYNSVVATFCHNIARDIPIQVNDPEAALTLVYIDDVIEQFIQLIDGTVPLPDPDGFIGIHPQYTTTVGEIEKLIRAFKYSRSSLVTERVGIGLVRALYATFISYLPVDSFAYDIPQYADQRGTFVEMVKTPDCGQFSFFTALPGVTRGGHYHHSKTEKFLVMRGQALFRFRHMHTGQTHEFHTSGNEPKIVETVPGWTHDITNIGNEEMLVMLWANEIFDRARPDTYNHPL